jgi:hypothetical protein
MAKFRKLPVVIEAVECAEVKRNIYDAPASLPQWIIDSYSEVKLVNFPGGIMVRTTDGNTFASLGDWIIRDVGGELYTCKPEVFKRTYEAVE